MTTEPVDDAADRTVLEQIPEEEAPPPQKATLALLTEMAAARKGKPPVGYTCPETGLRFVFKRLSGADVDRIASWAAGDDDKYSQIMVEEASVSPKINLPMWAAIQDLSPIVRASMLLFIREISGMGEGAVEKAKLVSKQAEASS